MFIFHMHSKLEMSAKLKWFKIRITFLNPVVLLAPEPWIIKGWKNTVSPFSISTWIFGREGS